MLADREGVREVHEILAKYEGAGTNVAKEWSFVCLAAEACMCQGVKALILSVQKKRCM